MASNYSVFKQLIGETDPYKPYLGAVNALNFTPQKAGDEGTALGVALGKALLGGILSGKQQLREDRQLDLVNEYLANKQLSPDQPIDMPEGMDRKIFSSLEADSLKDVLDAKQKRKNALELERDKLGLGIVADTPEFRQGTLAKYGLAEEPSGELPSVMTGKPAADQQPQEQDDIAKAYALYKQHGGKITMDDALSAVQTKQSRDDTQEKESFARATGLRKELQSTEAADKYNYMSANLDAFVEAYLDKNPVSDYELIRKGAQAVEPGLAVRMDDERSLQRAASIFGSSVQQVKAWILGESRLTPEQRAGIARTVQRNFDSASKAYKQKMSDYRGLAARQKADAESVVPFDDPSLFADLYPKLNISGENMNIMLTNDNLQKALAERARRQRGR